MDIYYDTEFLEDGRTIELISIGMVREDGAEYYAIRDAPWIMREVVKHDWLRANVLPSLPVLLSSEEPPQYRKWDPWHPDYSAIKPLDQIAREVRDFILAAPDPELWAWYGAYDHVVLCQLWGTMMHLPEGVPMWTNDLKQECERLGNPEMPPMPGVTEHNALSDAREVRFRRLWLATR